MASIRVKIILLVLTMILLVTTCGVVAYALTMQSVVAKNQIMISDKGQAKSYIKISDFIGPSNNSSYTELSIEPSFDLILEKSRDEDEKEGQFVRDVQFSYKNYYRYYIVKVEIQNLSGVDAYYSINCLDEDGNNFTFSSQVEIKYLQKSGEGFDLVQTLPSGIMANNQEVEIYVVFSVLDGLNLWNLSTVTAKNLVFSVEVNV